MAEVKNNFLGAKMNKDVDPRIIPPGEYRNALNLQINKSEGSNVGDLQTSLGNEIAVDFKLITGNSLNVNFQCIGSYADEKSNTIIFFFTDYNQPAGSPVYNELAKNYIYMYNDLNGAVTKLVEGAFLNFSITNPIIGVNLLEELLFWTDNRNQPRKINIVTAQQQPGYLSHISSFDGQKQIFISYWESEEAIHNWQNNEIHKAAKAKATVWYDAFISQVCKVEHASFFQAAKLSN